MLSVVIKMATNHRKNSREKKQRAAIKETKQERWHCRYIQNREAKTAVKSQNANRQDATLSQLSHLCITTWNTARKAENVLQKIKKNMNDEQFRERHQTNVRQKRQSVQSTAQSKQ